jgi:hypothetical protein
VIRCSQSNNTWKNHRPRYWQRRRNVQTQDHPIPVRRVPGRGLSGRRSIGSKSCRVACRRDDDGCGGRCVGPASSETKNGGLKLRCRMARDTAIFGAAGRPHPAGRPGKESPTPNSRISWQELTLRGEGTEETLAHPETRGIWPFTIRDSLFVSRRTRCNHPMVASRHYDEPSNAIPSAQAAKSAVNATAAWFPGVISWH